MMTQKDILTRVKIKLRGKYTESQIEFISNHFFETLRYYLANPPECKGGVHLEGFLDFNTRFFRMKAVVENKENKEYPSRLVESFRQCLENNNFEYERQTTQQEVNEGNDELRS